MFHITHNHVHAFSAHGFEQQHFEVFPLHRAGVLEFVNHDVLELGADFLKDEGRVLVINHGLQQCLRVAEHKTVDFAVDGLHLIFYAIE